MTNHTFPCSACGAPNKPEAGQTRMACEYCGTALTIPERLREQVKPRVEKIKTMPMPEPNIDAPDLLRKAQPIAIGAWNLFALWTRLRWIIPTCLVFFLISMALCLALGAFPIILRLLR
jgi:DNA-directed RNA polymerase subunit RPC12/RpoP